MNSRLALAFEAEFGQYRTNGPKIFAETQTMPKAAIIPAAGKPVEAVVFDTPQLQPGSALLETVYSEVCGTDVHLQRGHLAGVPYPIIPGHVSVGRVAETAGEVRDTDQRLVHAGDLVTFLDVHESCNHCWYCLVARATTRCPERKVYGITYSADDGLLGGWSEQIYLKPGVKIIPLPACVPPERFIAAGCALPTSLHAVDRAEIQIADTVVVQGAGPVGLNAAILAMISGAGKVIIVDHQSTRTKAAEQLGIDEVICSDDADSRVDSILKHTSGRGADITIEATGAPTAVDEGLRMTRAAGRYVIVGHYTDMGTVAINPHTQINQKHLDIRGCWGSDFRHFYRAVQIVDRFNGQISGGGWDQLVTHTYGLNELNEALDAVDRGETVKALVDPTK